MMTLANLRGGGITHWQKYRDRGELMPVAIVVGCSPGGLSGAAAGYRRGSTRSPSPAGSRARRSTSCAGAPSTSWCRRRRNSRSRPGRPGLSGAGRPVRRIPRPCRARRIQSRHRGDRDHAPPRRRHPLDHQPGDAERIERHQAARLRAGVPLPSARQPRHQGDQARRSARTAHQSAQAGDPAVRGGHPPLGSMARPQRDVDAAGDRRQVRRRGRRGHRPRQRGFDLLGDVLSVRSHRGHPCGPLPRAWARSADGRCRAGFGNADRRHHEASDAAACAPQARIHGKCQGAGTFGLLLRPETPWFGYSLGDWSETSDAAARQAARGRAMDRSDSYRQRRRKDIAPNTPTRIIEDTRSDD